ncbi:hypothetical protein ACI2K4_02985 [Micromonospora sp. NPDC050397]|uniref:hypothetical protein n=1 Tax=Micromonospora sp. NPDC050397 TaxID=3364279 RepID=UPI00384DC6CA
MASINGINWSRWKVFQFWGVSGPGLVILQLLLIGPLFGLMVALALWAAVELLQGLVGPLTFGLGAALAAGVVVALGGGLGVVLTLTAWGHWVVFVRIWLPLTGRLPWAVLAFLEDAHQRGVLRQAGAVYQFRHARLHDHLMRVA